MTTRHFRAFQVCVVILFLVSPVKASDLGRLKQIAWAFESMGAIAKVQFSPHRMERFLPLVLASSTEPQLLEHLEDKAPELLNPKHSTLEPVVFVNGAGISLSQAKAESRALAVKLNRPVLLFYNDTHGIVRDVAESAVDRFGPVLMPLDQLDFNPTSRRLAHYLFHASAPVAIVSHSQGCILVRNALLIVQALRPMRNDVAWLATGMPLSRSEIYPEPVRFHSLTNRNDLAAVLLADLRADLLKASVAVLSNHHDFRAAYLEKITSDLLFGSNDPQNDDVAAMERKWEGVWSAPSGLASVKFRSDGVYLVDERGVIAKGRLTAPDRVTISPTPHWNLGGEGILGEDSIRWAETTWRK